MRITENIKFNSCMNSLSSVQEQYNSLLEKMASQKRINRPSDDPVGVTRIVSIKQQQAGITQYRTNVDRCDSWASITESKLSSANDLLVNAKELALSQATATASATTRSIAAAEIDGIIEEMLAIANSKYDDRYIFAGSSSQEPFRSVEEVAAVGNAQAAEGNDFDGTVTSGGTYAGDANKTYVVKATSGGALAAAKYVVSSDGGKTWGSEQTGLDNPITLGDGILLTFAEGTSQISKNDLFTVKGTTAGYYQGNGESLTMRIGQSLTMDYNISGEEAFTDQGQGGADVFKILNDLKTALEDNDVDAIDEQLGNLDTAQENVRLCEAKCGTKSNSIEIAKANMDELEERLTTSLSNTEDADITELATQFAMKEVALQASYAMASKIGQYTIFDFLR